LATAWGNDVARSQAHRVLTGFQPFRSMANIASGIFDLVFVPYKQYQRDGRIIRGVGRGAGSFVRKITTETLHVTSRLASGTQNFLEYVEGGLTSIFDTMPGNRSRRKLRGRALALSRNASQPAHIREGLTHAYAAVSRGFFVAANGAFLHPRDEYQRHGPARAIKSAVAALPSAMIAPVKGLVEAVGHISTSAANDITPLRKIDNANKYKHS